MGTREQHAASGLSPKLGRAEASLAEIAIVFLKLGTTAFGGPAAHIAMMEQDFVLRRCWLLREDFLDRLGAANLIPGPSSTEMAIFIGYEKRGFPGLIVAGCCFILPAAIMVALIAAAYVRYGSLPQVNGILYAVKPVVIAVIIQAFWNLAHTAVKSKWLFEIASVAAVLFAFQVHPVLVLAIAAMLAVGPMLYAQLQREASGIFFPFAALHAIAALTSTGVPVGLGRLFLVFLKIGAVLFGSGYVLLAFLRADLVEHLHWLTERQLLDAVAVGQITPGPVFTTATFIGYVISGTRGAVVATLGVFAPAFIFVAISGLVIPKIRRSQIAGAMLDGVVVGSLALMGVVACQLGRTAMVDAPTVVIAVVSLAVLLRFKINSAWPVVAAAVFGWLHR
jgi:chromate transporter